MNKKLLFIISLLIIIIATSTTYAEEFNTQDVVVCDNNINTFDDVQNLVASPNQHNEVFLKNTTYVANLDKPITINSNLLIYGSKHIVDTTYSTLDANGLSTIFNIAENCTVKLANINIINSKSTSSSAILIGAGSTVTIANVNFINNTGGAITVNSQANVFCSNTKFINNSAANGAAICGEGNINVIDSYFSNNLAYINGGAIYGTSNINVNNARFYNNKAYNGGAIWGYESVIISNSIFNENSANVGGGAIFTVKSLNVENSSFDSNVAGFGGAVAVETDISNGAIQVATILNSFFTNNSANNGPGAAIYVTGDLTVSGSSFESTNCKGGSVIFVPIEGSLTSENNLFASDLKDTNLKSNVLVSADKVVGNTVKIYIYVPYYSEGDIVISLNKMEIKTIKNTLNQSLYVFDVPNLVNGVNNISVRYRGDNKFVADLTTISVNTQTKSDIVLDIAAPEITYKETAIITISSSVNGVVEVHVGHLIFNRVTISNNKASISVPNLDAGNYLVEVIYKGNSKYNAKTAKTILNVIKANSMLSVTSSVSVKNGVVRITSNMPGNFTILLNDKYYDTIYSNNGNSTFTIPNLGGGRYTVTVISNNSNYHAAKASTSFSIKDNVEIKLVSSSDFYSNFTAIQGYAYRISPITGNQFALINVTLVFTVDGKNYTVETNKQGDAYLYIDLQPGYYPVTLRLQNQEAYDCYSVVEGYIEVLPLIQSKDIIVDENKFNYTARLIDRNGKPIANKEMEFDINGVIKKAITNSNGEATVEFTNIPVGTYQMLISANNFVTSSNVTILPANVSAMVVLATVNFNKAQITAVLTQNINQGIVLFDVNGVIYNVTIADNIEASLTLNDLANNLYRVTATLICKDYAPISNNTSFRINIPRGELRVEVDPVEINYRQNAVITVKVATDLGEPLNKLTVTISIDGKTRSKTTDVDGIAQFTISNLDAGIYTVYVECKGNNAYSPRTVESSVTVQPLNVSSMVLSSSVNYNDVTVTATFSEIIRKGNVIFNINGVEYIESISGNKAVLKAILPSTGSYTVTATLNSPNYNPISNTTTFEVKEMRGEVIINAPNLEMYYKDGTKFVVRLTNEKGTPLEGIKIKIKLNGGWYDRTTDKDGFARMNINLAAELYPVVVTFGGNNIYNAKTVEADILVKSTILGKDLVKIFRNGSQLYNTFLESNGNPIVGVKVTYNINGVMYDRTTNSTGGTRFNINLAPGTYILTATNPSNGEMRSFTVTVKPNMLMDNVTKYFKNNTQVVVQLLDNQGNPATQGTVVKFNINGVFYERKAKENGLVTFNINLAPGTYILTAMYNDLMMSSTVKVLSTVETEDVTMTTSARVPFVAKALNKQGKPAAKGSVLSFNINGVIYNRVISTDDGTTKLNINLAAGKYIITTMYDGLMQSNTVTIVQA